MNALPEEVCPNCGDFVDSLRPATGWCGTCTARFAYAPPRPYLVEKRCKHCGMRYRVKAPPNSKPRAMGTCGTCITKVRKAVRAGKQVSKGSGTCRICQREFEFRKSTPRVHCDRCLPEWYHRNMVAVGKASGLVPHKRNPNHKLPVRDPASGRWLKGNAAG